MTRAALLVLRAAGQLRTECHYIVTDGPVIGTAGNTSPTQIEMHAVSATELSSEVSVNTNFGGTADTWPGGYDIDLGTNGSIFLLTDDFNNQVVDSAANAPTVHTQFPWHARGTRLQDNVVDASTLTGWAAAWAAGCTLNDNTLRETTVNLTGKTSGTFLRNTITAGFFNALVPTSFIFNNQLTGASVDHQGTGAGSFSFQNNTMLTGTVAVDAATTAQVTMNSNVFGGTSSGFRVNIEGKTGLGVIVSGNRLFNQSVNTSDLRIKGSSQVNVTACQLSATKITIDGTTTLVQIANSAMNGTTVTRDPASAGALSITQCDMGPATITVGPSNGATTNLFNVCTVRQGVFTLNGPVAGGGRNDFVSMHVNTMSANVAATATAGLHIDGGYHDGATFNQNRAAGTAATAFYDCDSRGFTTVTDNGAVDPVQEVGFNRCQFRDALVTVGSLAARSVGSSTIVQQVDLIGSTFTVTGMGATGFIDKGRMTGTTLDNGGFTISIFDIVGGTKTLTANQSDRVRNASFSNLI